MSFFESSPPQKHSLSFPKNQYIQKTKFAIKNFLRLKVLQVTMTAVSLCNSSILFESLQYCCNFKKTYDQPILKIFKQQYFQLFLIYTVRMSQYNTCEMNYQKIKLEGPLQKLLFFNLAIIINQRKKMFKNRKNKIGTEMKPIDLTSEQEDNFILGNSIKKLKKDDCQQFQKISKSVYQKIDEIPEYELSYQQMQGDPAQLVMKLQQHYKEFGAIKLKTCKQWNPPFSFRYTEKGITTRIQKIHKLTHGKVALLLINTQMC